MDFEKSKVQMDASIGPPQVGVAALATNAPGVGSSGATEDGESVEQNASLEESVDTDSNNKAAPAKVVDSSEDGKDGFYIPGVNPLADIKFYMTIDNVDTKAMSAEECVFTDQHLESLTTVKLRQLGSKMAYEIWDRKDRPKKVRKDGIPTSGNKGPLLGRILVYYHFMRQEQTTDRSREINHAPTFTPEEDARLIEILSDPSIYSSIKYAFQSGTRADIDGVSG